MTVVIPRVLVVSESRITRRVVEMTFADQPVELVVAITGPAGLAAWDAQPFAVVLADVAMDGTGGLALARHVQAKAGSRPAAVLLMAGQHDVVDDAANAAADVRGPRARAGAGPRAGGGAAGRGRRVGAPGARRDRADAVGARRALSPRRFGVIPRSAVAWAGTTRYDWRLASGKPSQPVTVHEHTHPARCS